MALVIVIALLALAVLAAEQSATGSGGVLDFSGGGTGSSDLFSNATATLSQLAAAISNFEGFGASPTNRPTRNNNPGDLKPPGGNPSFWAGQTGVDSGGFAIFSTPQAGQQALLTNLTVHASRNPNQTLAEYIAAYNDNGPNSGQYADTVASQLGVGTDTLLGDLSA